MSSHRPRSMTLRRGDAARLRTARQAAGVSQWIGHIVSQQPPCPLDLGASSSANNTAENVERVNPPEEPRALLDFLADGSILGKLARLIDPLAATEAGLTSERVERALQARNKPLPNGGGDLGNNNTSEKKNAARQSNFAAGELLDRFASFCASQGVRGSFSAGDVLIHKDVGALVGVLLQLEAATAVKLQQHGQQQKNAIEDAVDLQPPSQVGAETSANAAGTSPSQNVSAPSVSAAEQTSQSPVAPGPNKDHVSILSDSNKDHGSVVSVQEGSNKEVSNADIGSFITPKPTERTPVIYGSVAAFRVQEDDASDSLSTDVPVSSDNGSDSVNSGGEPASAPVSSADSAGLSQAAAKVDSAAAISVDDSLLNASSSWRRRTVLQAKARPKSVVLLGRGASGDIQRLDKSAAPRSASLSRSAATAFGDNVHSTPDVFPSADDLKMAAQRRNVILEIVETEEQHVKSLELCEAVFLAPLQRANGELMPLPLVTRIFGNLPLITRLSGELADKLRDRISETDKAEAWCIGDIFDEFAPFLKIYTPYCKNFEAANTALTSALRYAQALDKGLRPDSMKTDDAALAALVADVSGEFADFWRSTLRNRELQGLTLPDFLAKPIQRVCKWPLLLRELAKATPKTHPDFEPLALAISKMNDLAMFVNESKRDQDNRNAVLDLTKSVTGLSANDRATLVQPGRSLVKRGAVLLISRTKAKDKEKEKILNTKMEVFLLTDMVFFTTVTSSSPATFKLKFKEDLAYASIAENDDASSGGDPLVIQLMLHPSKTSVTPNSGTRYRIGVQTEKEKSAWLEAIMSCLHAQAQVASRLAAAANISSPKPSSISSSGADVTNSGADTQASLASSLNDSSMGASEPRTPETHVRQWKTGGGAEAVARLRAAEARVADLEAEKVAASSHLANAMQATTAALTENERLKQDLEALKQRFVTQTTELMDLRSAYQILIESRSETTSSDKKGQRHGTRASGKEKTDRQNNEVLVSAGESRSPKPHKATSSSESRKMKRKTLSTPHTADIMQSLDSMAEDESETVGGTTAPAKPFSSARSKAGTIAGSESFGARAAAFNLHASADEVSMPPKGEPTKLRSWNKKVIYDLQDTERRLQVESRAHKDSVRELDAALQKLAEKEQRLRVEVEARTALEERTRRQMIELEEVRARLKNLENKETLQNTETVENTPYLSLEAVRARLDPENKD